MTNGKKPIDLLDEIFNGNINVKDSTAKTKIDEWYKNNMISYASQLEDTVFCNDRTYYNFDTSGWNKDYSNYDKWLYYGSHQRLSNDTPSLVCPRQIDKFTVSNDKGNGGLTYPVGLITADEATYAGGVMLQTNKSYYLFNEHLNSYLSPCGFNYMYSTEFGLNSGGYSGIYNINSTFNLRPVVSLKVGTNYISGNGSSEKPFIITQ